MGQLKSSGLVEVEVLDTSGVLRGNLILEIIGQSLDAENGLPVIYVTLLASDSDAVLRWAIPNPGTPNGIHLSNRVVSKVPAFNEDGFVLVVERWRQRDPASVTEDWAKEAEAEGGAGLGAQAAEATAERREASAAHGRRAPADDQPGAARRAPGDPHGEPDRRAHRDLPAAARGPFRLSTANRRWSELRSWRTSSCQSRAFVRRACPTPARAWTSATTPRGLPAPGALPHGPGGAERPAAAEHEERSLQKALELAMKAKRRDEGDCGQM